jgi:hypothetical protein
MAKQITMRGRAFGGRLETLRITVDADGSVRVWDDIAGHYTRRHSLSVRSQTRARNLARK